MNLSQLANQIALLLVCVVFGAGCAAPTPAVQSATATPTAALTPTDLKYILLAKYPDFFFCDPDQFPVAHADETQLGLQRWPEVQQNAEQFQSILRHLNFSGANFSDDQKVSVYREFKKLNALTLQPASDGYTFQLRTSDGKNNGMAIEGTLSKQGAINVTKTQPTIATCPVCLAADTLIETPIGNLKVSDLREGMLVWSLDAKGARVAVPIVTTARVPVSATHHMIHIVLDDGRELMASPGHPTADGRALVHLRVGDALDGARVLRATRESYASGATYDILPASSSGAYWANGILIGSTLKSEVSVR